MGKIFVKVPASVGNMGSGFDCAGLSLRFYNTFLVEKSGKNRVVFENSSSPVVVRKAGELFMESFNGGLKYLCKSPFNVDVRVSNNIPFRRGFGSSGTIILAGIISAFMYYLDKIKKEDVLRLAVPIEKHMDNLAASLYGGFVLGGDIGGKTVIRKVAPHKDLRVIAFIPGHELSTQEARDILPGTVPLNDAVYNICSFGFLCYAFCTGSLRLLKYGTKDRIHQPYRGALMPYLEELVKGSASEKFYGACLSGAGPSVVFFAEKKDIKAAVLQIEAKIKKTKVPGCIRVFNPGGRTAWKVLP